MAGTRLLLVEGTNDLHVVCALFGRHEIPETFKVEDADGFEPLIAQIPVRLKASDLERLALIVDANQSITARWNRLRHSLTNAGYNVLPKKPARQGTIVDVSDRVRLGIWVMPDNKSKGMLEDFVALLISDEDEMLPHADTFLASIPSNKRRFPSQHYPKARIHAWLSVQEQPGKPMGQAITAHYLNHEGSVVDQFLSWIRSALVT